MIEYAFKSVILRLATPVQVPCVAVESQHRIAISLSRDKCQTCQYLSAVPRNRDCPSFFIVTCCKAHLHLHRGKPHLHMEVHQAMLAASSLCGGRAKDLSAAELS